MVKAILFILGCVVITYGAFELLSALAVNSYGSYIVSLQIQGSWSVAAGIGALAGILLVGANLFGPRPRMGWRWVLVAFGVSLLTTVLVMVAILHTIPPPGRAGRYHYYYFQPSGLGLIIAWIPLLLPVAYVIGWRLRDRS